MNFDDVEAHFKQNRRYLIHVASRFKNEEAEDIVQETYYRALKFIHTANSDSPAKFNAWVLSILRNVGLQSLNREALDNIDDYEDHESLAFEEPFLLHDFFKKKIKADISAMDEGLKKDVLTWYFVRGYPEKDVYELTRASRTYIFNIVRRYRDDLIKVYKNL